MDVKSILKWGVIVVVGFFVLRWLSGVFSNGVAAVGDLSVMNAPYAAPLAGPYNGVVGWAAPWQYAGAGVSYGGRPRRFRRGR